MTAEESQTYSSTATRRVVVGEHVVRITPHSRSGYVARVLMHLEAVGFSGAPRWLGRSSDGWDQFSRVEGSVLGDPPYSLGDAQLIAAAALVRDFHDAMAETDLCEGQQTVAHGDLGPHNTIFRQGLPVAILDWDEDVCPGQRAGDFADAVWSFTDLTCPDVPVMEQARRVAVMCAVYPGMSPAVVVAELTKQFERALYKHFAAGRTGPAAVFEGLCRWMTRHGPEVAGGPENPIGDP